MRCVGASEEFGLTSKKPEIAETGLAKPEFGD
jgi:hypothetical protein